MRSPTRQIENDFLKQRPRHAGPSVVEVAIVLVIMTLLLIMAVPVYTNALRLTEEQTAVRVINPIASVFESQLFEQQFPPPSRRQLTTDESKKRGRAETARPQNSAAEEDRPHLPQQR